MLVALQPAAQRPARLYVGAAFFRSGLTKIADWETTLALFQDEYKVPLLPTHVAAVLGAARGSGSSQWFGSAPADLQPLLQAMLVARGRRLCFPCTGRVRDDATASRTLGAS